ncbi:MAG: hypothetical protein ACRBBM_09065 [Pseudomonadaceae bacterium]
MEENKTVNDIDWPTPEIFQEFHQRYSYKKYPATDYEIFKKTFSELDPKADHRAALMWKWGHWGKDNFPAKQQALIEEIKKLWPQYCDFIQLHAERSSKATFEWWTQKLGSKRFITVAYLTHLIHHDEVPIIDQHNFRAMEHYLDGGPGNRKPNSWDDVLRLKNFLQMAITQSGRSQSDYDKYLMMYGRHLRTQ